MLPPIVNSPSGSFPPTVIKNGGRGRTVMHRCHTVLNCEKGSL